MGSVRRVALLVLVLVTALLSATARASAAGDTTPPSVPTVTGLTADQTVSGTVNVTAQATDNVGVTAYEFWANGTKLSDQASANYALNTTLLPVGANMFGVCVRDAALNRTCMANGGFGFTVSRTDTTPPSAPTVTGLSAGQTVGGTVSVTASATDNFGVTAYEFWANGTKLADQAGPSYALDTTRLANGDNMFGVCVRDAASNRSCMAGNGFHFTVANTTSDVGPIPANAAWWDDFETGDFSKWSWDGTAQPDLWPQYPKISVVQDPTGRDSTKVGRFEVSSTDAAAGRIHAKLYKNFAWGSASGTYTAWEYFSPSQQFLADDANYHGTNIFQFKDHFGPAGDSDPLVWVVAEPKDTSVGINAPWISLNGQASSWDPARRTTLPLNQWFELKAVVTEGVGADFYLNGRKWAHAEASEVSPFHPDARDLVFGVGNYGGADDSVVYSDNVSKAP